MARKYTQTRGLEIHTDTRPGNTHRHEAWKFQLWCLRKRRVSRPNSASPIQSNKIQPLSVIRPTTHLELGLPVVSFRRSTRLQAHSSRTFCGNTSVEVAHFHEACMAMFALTSAPCTCVRLNWSEFEKPTLSQLPARAKMSEPKQRVWVRLRCVRTNAALAGHDLALIAGARVAAAPLHGVLAAPTTVAVTLSSADPALLALGADRLAVAREAWVRASVSSGHAVVIGLERKRKCSCQWLPQREHEEEEIHWNRLCASPTGLFFARKVTN